MVDDQFGVKMLYPTKAGGETWYVNSGGTNFQGGDTLSPHSDGDGTYYTGGSKERMNAMTSGGYDTGRIEWNHKTIAQRGYMQTPASANWYNIEITAYWYISGSGDDDYVEYCGGGKHNDNTRAESCEGFAYKCAVNYNDGQIRIRKERWHSSGYTSGRWVTGYGSSVKNKWVGMKTIRAIKTNPSGQKYVVLEVWLDKPNTNTWTKHETITDGPEHNWTSGGTDCGDDEGTVGIWGGPLATFRWDTSGIRIRKMSVREIDYDGAFGPSPPPGPPSPPPGNPDVGMRLVYPSSGIVAIGDDGNLPANVNDLNTGTRWSNLGLPAWIKVDLTAIKKVMSVRIAFYRGIERVYGFNIQVSSDNSSFTTVFTGTALQTDDYQRFDFNDVNARWVMLTVTSNSVNTYSSISEFEVWGDDTAIGGTAPPPPPFQGQDPNFLYIQFPLVWNVNIDESGLICQ